MSKKRILILHTGGTLGMNLRGTPQDGEVFKKTLQSTASRIFEIADIGVEILFNKDSSDMVPQDWVKIAKRLHQQMMEWDGFVVTHGTDTMAFTAAALSFMLRNLPKPVILTGSQIPMSDPKSDGPRNLIHAVEIAVEGAVQEVSIFFDCMLLRGNRAKKISIPSFRAFESPNLPPLARVGVKTEYSPQPFPRGEYTFDPRLETRVLSIPLFPGIDTEFFWGLMDKGVKGLVLQAFGPGDIPISQRSVAELITSLTERGIPTIVCSQAVFGTVDLNLYETGRAARDAGAIGALDMTWEAALVKTMILLGRGLPMGSFKPHFLTNLAGELSSPQG